MTTALGSQLKALGNSRGSLAPGRSRTGASIVFGPKEAADVDLQTIFSLAQAGLDELTILENGSALEAYRSTIFNIKSMQTDRELQTREFNDRLDKSIASVLHLLSGFILLPACHQVVEYLIRRYKIHEHNVDDIMLTILPYHETSVFVRVVQLLRLEKTRWEVFSGVKKTGAAPPRAVLVQRCLRDTAFLEAVCESGMLASDPAVKSRVHAAFSTVVIMETLSTIPTIDTNIVRKVLPYILRALGQDVLEELLVGGLMVIGVMANRAVLAQKVTSSLIETLCSRAARLKDESTIRQVLLVLVQLVQTQDVRSISAKAGEPLLQIRNVILQLTDLAKKYDADKFLALLIQFMASQFSRWEREMIIAIENLPLEKHVEGLFCSLIFNNDFKDPDMKRILKDVVAALDKHFPIELDKCISDLLKKKTSDQNDTLTLLGEVFQTSLRRPMGKFRTTLYSSVDHPQVDVRKDAVRKIAELSRFPLDSEARQFIHGALVRRLDDDDPSVVQTVLSVKDLLQLHPSDELVKAIGRVILRSMDILKTGSKLSKGNAREIVQGCLKHLAASTQSFANVEEIQRVILCYLLMKEKTWKLNLSFLKVATQFPGPLFSGLPGNISESSRKGNMSKEDWRAQSNQEIIDALALAAFQNESCMEMLLDAAADNQDAKVLTTFVILRMFRDYRGTMQLRYLRFLQNEWVAIRKDIDIGKMQKMDYQSKSNTFIFLKDFSSQAYSETVLLTLYKVIQYSLARSKGDELSDELFIMFSESPLKIVSEHIALLLKHHSDFVLYLCKFFLSNPDVSEDVQTFGLDVLASCYRGDFPVLEEQLLLSVVCVLAALSSSLKSVRCAAMSALKESSTKLPAEGQALKQFLSVVFKDQENFIENASYFQSFCISVLQKEEDSSHALDLIILLKQIVKLPPSGQMCWLEVLKHAGHVPEKAFATQTVLFQLLQRRRLYHFCTASQTDLCIKGVEVPLIQTMLEINVLYVHHMLTTGQDVDVDSLFAILQSLDVDGGSLKDPVVTQPCLTVLNMLKPDLYARLSSPSQNTLFKALIILGAVPDDVIRPAAQQAIDALNVNVATISELIQSFNLDTASNKKLKLSTEADSKWPDQDKMLKACMSLLEYLSRKTRKNTWVGSDLLKPLFNLLRGHLNGSWPVYEKNEILGQLVLKVLENLINGGLQNASLLDVDLLVEYVVKTTNAVTRKSALAVLTAIAKRYPELVWKHVINIFSIVGNSTITLDDAYSHLVIQDLLEAVVPFWLKTVEDPKSLLEIFVKALPRIPEHRRVQLMKCVMRVTNAEASLPTFLFQLIQHATSEGDENWTISFADSFFTSFDSDTRASALVNLSLELSKSEDAHVTLQLGTSFLSQQLKLLRMKDLQRETALSLTRTLMVYALKQVQKQAGKRIEPQAKASVKAAESLLQSVMNSMTPSLLCKTVALQLKESDDALCRKVLNIYATQLAVLKSRNAVATDPKPHLEIVTDVLELVLRADSSDTKQTAVSVLELLVEMFLGSSSAAFVTCLSPLVANFDSKPTLAAACVRCSARIVSGVGAEALPNLPSVMAGLLKRAREIQQDETSLQIAIVQALESIVEKLGGFMNPYIEDILALVLLHLQPITPAVQERLASLRSLISKKVPARLLLEPLINVYKNSLAKGDESVASVFNMLAIMSATLDKSSVAVYHRRIFSFCMEAMDLRRKQPEGISQVHLVEDSVISVILALVMKLSETTFKPFFVDVHGWAESTTLDGVGTGPSIERAIVFFKLVNQLTEKLRSVFIPYFRYLLAGCVSRLNEVEESRKKKRKKAKIEDTTVAKWQVQQLVISALHKCFMYDTIGFLDEPKFQQLLVPLANQLIVEAPSQIESLTASDDVPTVEEADGALVACLVRMALTAGSDLFWKPLNHEVLMHTRRGGSERAKRLALDIVKSLVDNLKEEYLVLVAETLPFLAELLEDQDLQIVAKTQEIVKALEELSGESLKQFL